MSDSSAGGIPTEALAGMSNSSFAEKVKNVIPKNEPPKAPVIPMGDERLLSEVKIDLDDPEHTKKFQLESESEDQFEDLVAKHFLAFHNAPSGTPLDEWQVQFMSVFREQVEVAAGKKFDTIPPTELAGHVIAASKTFVANTVNLQTAEMIDRYMIKTMQKGLRIKIGLKKAATPDEVLAQLGEVADPLGNKPEELVGGSRINRFLRNRLVTRPIGKGRFTFQGHLTATEREEHALKKQQEKYEKKRNKRVTFLVEYQNPTNVTIDFAALSPAEKLLMREYGINMANTVVDQTTAGKMLAKVRQASEARGDFYSRTGFDTSKLEVDYRRFWQQTAHTQIEIDTREFLRSSGLPMTPENIRLETGRRALIATERRALEELADKKRSEKIATDTAVVAEGVRGLGNKRSAEEVEAETERIEKALKEARKQKEMAEEREGLVKQKEAAEQAIQAAHAIYPNYESSPEAQAQAHTDLETYRTWFTQKNEAPAKIAELEAQIVRYSPSTENLDKLYAERATLIASRPRTQVVKGKEVRPTDKEIETYDIELERITKNITEAGEILSGLVIYRARLASTAPPGWDEQKTRLTAAKYAATIQIPRIDAQIANGDVSKRYGTESVKVIERRIKKLTEELTHVDDADEFNTHRKEAYEVVQEYLLSDPGRDRFRENKLLIKEGMMPTVKAEVFSAWPKAHIRVFQGIFGSDIFRDPNKLAKVSRVLPPEKVVQLLIERHPGELSDDYEDFIAFNPDLITADDLQYIWDTVYGEAVDTKNLAKIDEKEEADLKIITSVEEDDSIEVPEEEVEMLEYFNYYYRDLADLQLRILTQWALAAHEEPYAYYEDPNIEANKALIQRAAVCAKKVDERRKQRMIRYFGNPASETKSNEPADMDEPVELIEDDKSSH